MKRTIVLVLIVAVLVSLAACSGTPSAAGSTSASSAVTSAAASASSATGASASSSSQAQAGEKKNVKVGYYGIDTTQAFFKDVYNGLDAACKSRGWTLSAEFTNYDPVKMKSAYNDFKSQNVDVIIDGNAMQDISKPFAEQAATDKIPYIGLHEDLAAPAYTYGTKNSDMGAAVGGYIGQMVQKEWNSQCDMVILVGTFTTGPQITERLTSAVPALGKVVQNIDSVKQIKIDAKVGDSQGTSQQVKDTLTANPNAKHICMFCQTDDMANAAFSAVEAAGRSNDVMGTGSDCSDVAVNYFKKAVDSNSTVPWRGSIYLGAPKYGEALCGLIDKILSGQQSEHAVTFVPGVVGVTNLYEYFPDKKG